MNEGKEQLEVMQCFHCGNRTPMQRTGIYRWGSQEAGEPDFDFLYTYEMFACPVCHNITLRQTYSDETMVDFDRRGMYYYDKKSCLYPANDIESEYVPQKVIEAYESALKNRDDKNMCFLALRRALEIALKEKGATRWGLQQKIEEIAEKGLLPGILKEASSIAKMLGDAVAHDKEEVEVAQQDPEALIEFVKYIIEYLFIVPGKIEEYKQQLSMYNDQ